MCAKVYVGWRDVRMRGPTGNTCQFVRVVVLDGERCYPLPPRHDLRDHSPDGFEWGYAGSGPAQLALALVADALGPLLAVPRLYQCVKDQLIAPLAKSAWVLREEDIVAVCVPFLVNADDAGRLYLSEARWFELPQRGDNGGDET